MKVAEGRIGRVFVLRLEDGDRLPDCVEAFAASRGVAQGFCAFVGGVGSGRIVVGPEDASAMPPVPVLTELLGAHEAAAVGTLFPNESGQPKLHMHATFGRGDEVKTGCIRPGIDIWTIGEFVLIELTGLDLVRKRDAATGFELLAPK
ncbi:MAG: DNA-binding protein [Humidesulfovibrio sp.]|uniref:PPC domain-containing DNA-binding protein n=1 Tax=Humidesulfovibrio sp. TaxID=2910988 RepID=UPI002732C766|nr:PPC domain-containing DNA-binding protein [Humidesulfovibrio sp.]MDP2849107.1 DNA-binding protein [Humidesulfovibrio sp.]